jgi:hypothetical protein
MDHGLEDREESSKIRVVELILFTQSGMIFLLSRELIKAIIFIKIYWWQTL